MSAGLSACVIARDEEQELARCLRSVRFADEIVVVVDARSRDGTEKVARELAEVVTVHPYAGDLEQKRHCVSLAHNDWILIIDPDEVMPEATAKRLAERIAAAPEGVSGFELNRLTWHLGRWIRHGDFFPDWTLRAFRCRDATWEGMNPHGRVRVRGAVERIDPPLLHYSYRDLADQVDRIQHFSGEAASALFAAGRRARLRDLVLRPPARFLRAYLLRGGFRDGIPGLVIASATAFHVFLKYAKLWELEREESRDPRG